MKNEFQRHKKSDGIKWVAVTIAIVMLAAAVMATMTKGFKDWNPYGWFDKKDPAPTTNSGVTDGNGNELVGGKVYPMSSKMLFSSPSALSDTAGSGVTVKATITPAQATDQTVDWAVSFVDPSSEWATGKTITDYITVTPTSDGALTATVVCLAPFGEQIKISVTSRANTAAKAECTVDFYKRIAEITSHVVTEEAITWSNTDTNVSIYFLESFKYHPYTIADVPANVAGKTEYRLSIPQLTASSSLFESYGISLNASYTSETTYVGTSPDLVWTFPTYTEVFGYTAADPIILSYIRSLLSEFERDTTPLFDLTCTYQKGTPYEISKVFSFFVASNSVVIDVAGITLDNSALTF